MARKNGSHDSFEDLEKLAHDLSDIRPLSAAMRRQWNAARRTGKKFQAARPRKYPNLKTRIVPISMDPTLLAQVDEYSKSAGLSRSKLVAEALRLRMQPSGEDRAAKPAAKGGRKAG